MKFYLILTIFLIVLGCGPKQKPTTQLERPNILWICVEDQNPLFGCYGALSTTPAVDSLASQGVLFKNAFATTAVCSPSRSALITGMMPTSIGAHNHRSHIKDSSWVHLPEHISTIPEQFRQADYFTFNQHYDGHAGKEDYNFYYQWDSLFSKVPEIPPSEESFWEEVVDRQPFYGQIQLAGGKIDAPWDPTFPEDQMQMLPYYPDNPFFRKMYEEHHMQAQRTDAEVGKILSAMRANGLLENTVVFFYTDHGWKDGIRHKQFCYDGGLHVPLVVSWEGNQEAIRGGKPRADLVSLIDVSASSLALAGLPIPEYMEGRNLFAENYQPREFVIGTRDRMDYTIDYIRTVRTDQYRYIKNYMPERPWLQPQYRDTHAFMMEIRRLYKAGKLNNVQSQFFAETKPKEEFYDHENDPYEINNLINDPAYQDEIERHREILNEWVEKTNDQGQYPESTDALRNIYERWGAKCVNPEYNQFRES